MTSKGIFMLSIACINLISAYKFEPILIVHGGAGDIPDSSVQNKIKGVKLAARIGYKKLQETGNVLDAVIESIHSMELDEYFNAGYGSVLTWDGEVEMDASIMNGNNLQAGCVSVAKNILHPISLARTVMEKTDHNYLAGIGLMNFAKENGYNILPDGYLVTEKSLQALEDYKKCHNKTNLLNRRSICQGAIFGEPGTVGAVAIDLNGNIAAATSTGGMTGKLPGRIGDSSILGAGTYADNNLGGISATGYGEMIMRYNVAQKILQLIEHKSMNIQAATEKILEDMNKRLNGTAGVVSIDASRNVGIYFTSKKMAWAYQKGNLLHFGMKKGDDFIEKL